MIEGKKFEWMLKDLGQAFTMPTEKQIEIYYNHLKNTPPDLLKKAFSLIEETYNYRQLPPIAKIKEAITEVYNQSTEPSSKVEPEGCDECHGTGIILKEELWYGVMYPYAVPCTCAKGKIYQKAWAPYNPRKIKIKGKPK